jgi:hypothetical protein
MYKEDLEVQNQIINKLFIGTFSTELGSRCLEHLKKTFGDRDIYKQGLTFEQTAFRQGEASVIRKIIETLEGAKRDR